MEPLSFRIRPTSLDDFIGQEHLVGAGKSLRTAIEHQHLFSFILWGPPGSGKTTFARIYASSINARFYELSAVLASKTDIKGIVAEDTGKESKVLFLDEIHRFNKAQQDALLPLVESGRLTLVGATTENPSFEVIAPLLSRCRVFVFKELSDEEISRIIIRAGEKISDTARQFIINLASGDARQAIGMIETAKSLYGKVTLKTLRDALASKVLRYDKAGDEHYNTISAFIKSMRAGQPDAAMYYLARMTEAGEDSKFIARRMVIFASEDIGLAVPTALVVANAVFRAVETIGYPECSINLAHGVSYLANCAKDRRAYDALRAAENDVRKYGNLPVPLKIRNAPTKLMKDLDYGSGYQPYTKDDLLPEKLKGRKYLKNNENNKNK